MNRRLLAGFAALSVAAVWTPRLPRKGRRKRTG